MHEERVEIGEEIGTKRTFVWALDWPGWCRSGKDVALAIDALIEHGSRYAAVATDAGLRLPDVSAHDLFTVESAPGGGSTDFGVPGEIVSSDRRPVSGPEGERLAALVGASWAALDSVVALAPAVLRKGPRGGGRDRDLVFDHVLGADQAYAQVMGIKGTAVDAGDRAAIDELRAAMLAAIGAPSDGAPIAGRKWPPRYAARRIAWHSLDHAWEIEDRSAP